MAEPLCFESGHLPTGFRYVPRCVLPKGHVGSHTFQGWDDTESAAFGLLRGQKEDR